MNYFAIKAKDLRMDLKDAPFDDDFCFLPCKIVKVISSEYAEIKFVEPGTSMLVYRLVPRTRIVDIDVKALVK